jgi:thiamine kinase-like enzyme
MEKILCEALTKMFGAEVIRASFNESECKGGTLGDVRLVEGIAETQSGETLPYKIVRKTQKKWERPGDPDSWRREYDLYQSGFYKIFDETLRLPVCYRAVINENETELWMEYVEGISGANLTVDMSERAALEIGRFQGKINKNPQSVQGLNNFGDTGYLRRDYEQWFRQEHKLEDYLSEYSPLTNEQKQELRDGTVLLSGKSYEYTYLRTPQCKIPPHLKQMIYDIDDNLDVLFEGISRLPIVLCHRDYWVENIFYNEGKINLIDWDTAGWGYLGEDLATLIADDYDFDKFEELNERLIPAYYKGAAESMDISNINKTFIKEMILLKFGYRIVQNYIFAEADEEDDRTEAITALQKIWNMDK